MVYKCSDWVYEVSIWFTNVSMVNFQDRIREVNHHGGTGT